MRWLVCLLVVGCHHAAPLQTPSVRAAIAPVARVELGETETPPLILLEALAREFVPPVVRTRTPLPIPRASDRSVWCGVTTIRQPWP